jgi:hypothetical protein
MLFNYFSWRHPVCSKIFAAGRIYFSVPKESLPVSDMTGTAQMQLSQQNTINQFHYKFQQS